jgi:hypothetical protein
LESQQVDYVASSLYSGDDDDLTDYEYGLND